MARPSSMNGSVLIMLYASIALVAVIGGLAINIMNGPVKTMAMVTKRTLAENHMMASGRLALMMSARDTGDCDDDGRIEPVQWIDAGSKPAPLNGGLLPPDIGAALQDPWGNAYGYCAWDHGAVQHDPSCGVSPHRLTGADVPTNPVIAIISSGPDRVFQTGCYGEGHGNYLPQVAGSDDMILSYSFAEAIAMSGGLWTLAPSDPKTATIGKNLSVTDDSGDEQLSFDAATRALSIGAGGSGHVPNIRTDFIQNLTANVAVEFLSDLDATRSLVVRGDTSLDKVDISTTTANAVAAIVTASGSSGIGIKARGTSKAIEAEGVIDMTDHKIINVSMPTNDKDSATKKYVDDKFLPVKKIKCEAFVFSGCSGGTTSNLDKSSLGDCKRSCEAAGVSCCSAQYATTASNPNTTLGECVGHAGGKPSGTLVNLLVGLLFPAHIGAYCYEQY